MKMPTTLLLFFSLMAWERVIAQHCIPDTSVRPYTFDWMAEEWEVHTFNDGGFRLRSPFHNNSALDQPNTNHLESAVGFGDYHPDDGWILVTEAMGLSEDYPVVFPQYVLYNRFESKLRYFVFLSGVTSANDVEINISFSETQSGVNAVSAALEHIFIPMDVIEGYEHKEIRITSPNGGYYAHGVWAVADFAIAYDPCTCEYTSALTISTTTRTYTTFKFNLTGGGDITQIIKPPVNKESKQLSNVFGGISNGISKGNSAYKSAAELVKVVDNLLVESANKRLNPGIKNTLAAAGLPNFSHAVLALNRADLVELHRRYLAGETDDELKAAIEWLTPQKLPTSILPTWIKNAIPFANTAFALLDFIIGGGKSTQPKPIHFNAAFRLKEMEK